MGKWTKSILPQFPLRKFTCEQSEWQSEGEVLRGGSVNNIKLNEVLSYNK